MTPVLQVDSLPLYHLGSSSIGETILNVMPVYFTVGNVAVKSKSGARLSSSTDGSILTSSLPLAVICLCLLPSLCNEDISIYCP